MEKDAIQHLQNSVTAQQLNEVLTENFEGRLVIAPDDHKLHDLEQYMEHRTRFRATLRTSSIEDYSRYIADHTSDALPTGIFFFSEKMTATGIFDIGTPAMPLHGSHKAILKLLKTAPFIELEKINGEKKDQRKMAEWLEDFAAYLRPWHTQPGDASHEGLTMAKCSTAIRRLEIEAKAKAGHEERAFGSQRSTLESIDMRSRDMELPDGFIFTCTPYDGLKERDFWLRLSMANTPSGPQLCLRLVREEIQIEEMAQEFKDIISGKLAGANCTIVIGTMEM